MKTTTLVIAGGVAGLLVFLWWRHRQAQAAPAPAPSDAASVPPPVTPRILAPVPPRIRDPMRNLYVLPAGAAPPPGGDAALPDAGLILSSPLRGQR